MENNMKRVYEASKTLCNELSQDIYIDIVKDKNGNLLTKDEDQWCEHFDKVLNRSVLS